MLGRLLGHYFGDYMGSGVPLVLVFPTDAGVIITIEASGNVIARDAPATVVEVVAESVTIMTDGSIRVVS